MKVLFTCGGTAGHINPALAIAGRLKERYPDSSFLFIGAQDKMEMQLVPFAGYNIKGLKITNISRGHKLSDIQHNFDTVKNVAVAVREAKKIIREFKPDIVVGTGGYVCYPVLLAASELHIPTAVHESNSEPGLTTKLLAPVVDRVMLGFESSAAHYQNKDKLVFTGTPVKGEFDQYDKAGAKKELGLAEDEPLVVSVWGSLGAGHMNNVMSAFLDYMEEDRKFRLIHSTGKQYFESFLEKAGRTQEECIGFGADIREYIFDMPRIMKAADLVMCRAGASTLSELCYIGMPAIIVPSPNVTNNHQEKNARVLEVAGGAKVFLEGEFDARSLYDEVNGLLSSRDTLDTMSAALKGLAMADATDKICDVICGLSK